MERINTSTKAVNLFGAGKHGFTAGVPGTATMPTAFSDSWANAVQEELANVVEGAGLALTPGDNSQVMQALNLSPSAGEISAAVSTPRRGFIRGDIRRYGAVAGGSAATNRTAIQAAIDAGHEAYIPDGVFSVNAGLKYYSGTRIIFQSRKAQLQAALSGPILYGHNQTTERLYNLVIENGLIHNTAKANAGGIGLDLTSMTDAKIWGLQIQQCERGIVNGGALSQGAYYNEFHGVGVSGADICVDNGKLGNDSAWFGGRGNDCRIATRDNENSGTAYNSFRSETFSEVGHLVADLAAATNIRFSKSRLETATTTAIGFWFKPLAQVAGYDFPQFTGPFEYIRNESTTKDSNGLSDLGLMLKSGAMLKKIDRIPVVKSLATINAGVYRQEQFIVPGVLAGDVVMLIPPPSWPAVQPSLTFVTTDTLVYVPLKNDSGANQSFPAGETYRFLVLRF